MWMSSLGPKCFRHVLTSYIVIRRRTFLLIFSDLKNGKRRTVFHKKIIVLRCF